MVTLSMAVFRPKFQSPPSVRKATQVEGNLVIYSVISIPAFREEGDGVPVLFLVFSSVFQSPPSVRKATVCQAPLPGANIISIPAFGEDGEGGRRPFRTGPPLISIPAFREEGDTLGKVLL